MRKNSAINRWTVMMLVFSLATTVIAQPNTATINIQADQPGVQISSNLFGIFFEEINSAGDGGIYAEMVRNRSFEDSTNSLPYWSLVTNGFAVGQMSLDTSLPLSATNLQCVKLSMLSGLGTVGVANGGYWGMSVSNGATYNLGFYARCSSGFGGAVTAALKGTDGPVYTQTSVGGLTTAWQHFDVTLTPTSTDPNAQLVLSIAQVGTVWLDFVSLFPAQTFNNRTNGLRPDLARMLLHLKPSFVRFPGGSWVDGVNLANAYHWEPTVGDPANRLPRNNLWGYMVDNGLGYHEYLQICEDLGAAPLFCINCGMDVNQNAVPTSQLASWVQEALDAIQYANGDTSTPWGAQRAANGHPAPFNLQYMEIGNENGGTAYNANYAMFYDAIKSNYPSMHLIADSWGGIPSSRPVEIMDEHYYSDPSFFINNATKYDTYSRNGPKVFIGEYAATSGSGNGNLIGALGEAAFMTGLERNSDIVSLASYAPLFANLNNKNWNPDLIYFTGNQVYGTPSYYVQQMFSLNRGDYVLPAPLSANLNLTNAPPHGAVGLGSWNTSVQYTNLVVTSNGVTLYQSDFVHQGTSGWNVYNGTWSVSVGVYQQTALITDCRSTTGNTNWANYTITLQARKVSGSEGFLIMFNWLDDNDWTWWNIGGWNNTLDGIEQMVNGGKSLVGSQVAETINSGQWYNIQIVLTGPRIQCYLNGALVHDVNYPATTGAVLASASYAESSGQIIVKAVNASAVPVATTFNLTGLDSVASSATVIQLTSGSPTDENSLADPTLVFPTTNTISTAGTNFTLTLPANSLSILRLQAAGIHAITNLQIEIPSPINVGQAVAAAVWAHESGQANLINLATNSNHPIAFTSANANIAVVDASGNVTGVGPGVTTITANYTSLGLTSSQSVQVVGQATALAHRYSFNDGTANDSIGGANGTLHGNTSISGGQLIIPNTTSVAPGTDYLQLPAGIVTNFPAATVEAWATIYPGQYTWANLFDFGSQDASGQSAYDIHACVHSSGNSTIAGISDSDNANVDYQYIDLGSGSSLDGRTNIHITSVFNPPAGYVAIYVNGVLAGANYNVTIPMSGLQDVRNIIGADNWPDPGMKGTIDEFRIYRGALQADEIAATDALGPNQLLSSAPPVLNAVLTGGNLTLEWALASSGYTLQSSSNLVSGSWTTVAPPPQIIGSQWQVTVPAAGNTQFYRLQK